MVARLTVFKRGPGRLSLYLDEDSLKFHQFPIDSTQKTSNSKALRQNQGTYLRGATLAAALALGIVAFALPHVVTAFWPFSSFTNAAQADNGPTPVVPDSNLTLLAAAVNSDPNPAKAPEQLELSGGAALIADQGPEGIPDIDATPKNGTISQYVVRDGDTLSQIAATYGVSTNTILWGNDLKSANDIHPGQTLVILPVTGVQHTVVKGDTIASLAKKYSANPDDIAAFNGLDSSASLVVGSALIIPGGEISSTASGSSSSSSKSTKNGSKSSGSKVKSGGGLINIHPNPYRGGSGAALPGFFGNPVPGGIITQGIHGWNGVDIGAHTGTPIYAAAAGSVVVSRSGGWNGGYGSYVVVSHANGTQTLYSHMSSVAASIGQTVSKGTLLGYVGMTGDATGPHLHFEVRGARNPFADCSVGSPCSPE